MKKLILFGTVFFLLAGAADLSSGHILEKKDDAPIQKQKEDKVKMAKKYKKWLDEDVLYIISGREKEVFKSLQTDRDRENFIRTFWRRRDPTPGTPLNEFREEHYRRIAYANKHYFEGRTGWRTDRGRIYIMFGPPDFLETNPGGGKGFLFGPSAPTAEFASEVWTYRYIPGLKRSESRVEFIFVNYYDAGSYQLTSSPSLANALRNISVAARYAGYGDAPDREGRLTPGEMMDKANKAFEANMMEQLSVMAELNRSRGEVLEEMERSERLRTLKGIVDTKESMQDLSIHAQENFFLGDAGLTYIPLSIEVAARHLGFVKEKDRYRGMVNFYIEVRSEKGTVYQASDRLEMNLREQTYQRRFTDFYQYKHSMNLNPGKYILHLVVWDELKGSVGYIDRMIEVPAFKEDEVGLSEVILARNFRVVEQKDNEQVYEASEIPALKNLEKTGLKVPETVKIRRRSASPFTFDNLQINPNTLGDYLKTEELVFFYQIYNPTFDEAQNSARILMAHELWKNNKLMAEIKQPHEVRIPKEQQVTGINILERYPLKDLYPGNYVLKVKVTDLVSGKTVETEARFTVREAN